MTGLMPLNRSEKITVYFAGVLLGMVVLMFLPRPEGSGEPHPWHGQTAPDGFFPRVERDAYGREVELVRQPRWLISLAPSVTEMLFAMDLGDHLMARTRWCVHPAAARELPSIGNLDQPDLERILSSGADLVIGTDLTPQGVYRQLEQAGKPAVALSHNSWEDVLEDIRSIALMLGVPRHGLQLTASMQGRRMAVEEALLPARSNHPARRVLLLYDLDSFATAGSGTWVGDLIEASHAVNLGSQTQAGPWPRLNREAVLAMNPEVLLLPLPSTNDDERAGDTAEASAEALRQRLATLPSDPYWRNLAAVQQGRIVLIPPDLLSVPGPRMADALTFIAQAIWPEFLP